MRTSLNCPCSRPEQKACWRAKRTPAFKASNATTAVQAQQTHLAERRRSANDCRTTSSTASTSSPSSNWACTNSPANDHRSRRGVLALLPATVFAAAAASMLPPPPSAHAAATTSSAGVSDAAAAAIADYLDAEDKGRLRDYKALENFRQKYGIRRGLDGRVSLRRRSGEWLALRLDMEVPGALLLRDSKGGVYAIETEGLPQVDLSDDYVCLMMFADGGWEEAMTAVEYEDEEQGGQVVQLNLSEKEFREFVGILKEFVEQP